MRGLKILVVAMGVLIVAGVIVLVTTIVRRMGAAASVASSTSPPLLPTAIDEPAGTQIAQIAAAGDRIVLLLHGGGPDRVLVLDQHTGQVLARTGLAR